MGAKLDTKGGFNDINMTPLIDIVLVVLIIMMVNIPIQVEQMTIKLPAKIENPPPQQEPTEQLVIAMYEDGTLALNRKLMKEDKLLFEVTRRLRNADPKNVFIDAAPKVGYGRVVDMMDLAREAGAVKVGLAKMKETGPQQATSVDEGATPRGMTVGTPTVLGPVKQAEADAVLQPWKGNLEKCYFDALGLQPGMNGRVLAYVVIDYKGTVYEHKITDSSFEAGPGRDQADACIDQVIAGFKFEKISDDPKINAVIQYPLLYSPG
jgi:biopolymer transport protein ExbD